MRSLACVGFTLLLFACQTVERTEENQPLQWGVFRQRSSAETLQNRLIKEGLEARISSTLMGFESVWVVWSGPHSKARAHLLQQRLGDRGFASIAKPEGQL